MRQHPDAPLLQLLPLSESPRVASPQLTVPHHAELAVPPLHRGEKAPQPPQVLLPPVPLLLLLQLVPPPVLLLPVHSPPVHMQAVVYV